MDRSIYYIKMTGSVNGTYSIRIVAPAGTSTRDCVDALSAVDLASNAINDAKAEIAKASGPVQEAQK